MRITDVRVRKPASSGSIKGFASIVIDNAIAIHDIKIIEGEKGLFMAMPARKTSDGTHVDIAHPINNETRDLIRIAVFEAYNNLIKESKNE